MKFEYVLPVLALVIGWFLKASDQRLARGRRRKRLINIALSELLDIRHHLTTELETFRTAMQQLPSPDMVRVAVFEELQQFAGRLAPTQSAYAGAVRTIAGFDPLLAFRLRGLAKLPSVVQDQTRQAKIAGIDQNLAIATAVDFMAFSVGQVEEGIRLLAWRRGLLTWVRVRRHLSARMGSIPDLDRFVQRFNDLYGNPEQRR